MRTRRIFCGYLGAIGVALFVPPDSQQRRSLGNALFKEQVTAEGQLLFIKDPGIEEHWPKKVYR